MAEQGLKCGEQLGGAVWLVHQGNLDLEPPVGQEWGWGKELDPGHQAGQRPQNSRSGEESGPASAGSFVSFPPICFHKQRGRSVVRGSNGQVSSPLARKKLG